MLSDANKMSLMEGLSANDEETLVGNGGWREQGGGGCRRGAEQQPQTVNRALNEQENGHGDDGYDDSSNSEDVIDALCGGEEGDEMEI